MHNDAVPDASNLTRDDLLRRIAEGRAIVGLAWQEQAGTMEYEPPALTVSMRNDQRVAHGRERWVHPGAADGWLVACREDGNDALYWIAAGTAGLTAAMQARVDGSLCAELRRHGAGAWPHHRDDGRDGSARRRAHA